MILLEYYDDLYDVIFNGRNDINNYPFHNYLTDRLESELDLNKGDIAHYVQFYGILTEKTLQNIIVTH